MKKKKVIGTDLVVGGIGLSVGASVVERLPNSAAKTGVQSGLGTAGGYFRPMASIEMSGALVNKLRKLRRKK